MFFESIKTPPFIFRNTHQDGIENFFGCVKSSCQNSKAPIPMHFRTGYATMIINNITGSNSLNANCEPDLSVPLLNNVHAFFLDYKHKKSTKSNSGSSHSDETNILEAIIFDPQFTESELKYTEKQAICDSSNLIYNKLLQATACQECRNNLQYSSNNSGDVCVNNPSTAFIINFQQIFSKINQMIPDICSEKSLKKLCSRRLMMWTLVVRSIARMFH